MSSMLATIVLASAFEELGIGISLHANGVWRAIHQVPGIIQCEAEHGSDLARFAYNEHSIALARTQGRNVLGEHAGLRDWFVPVDPTSADGAVLVAGPFATRYPTSAELSARWHALTHTEAHIGDPAFVRYLSESLATLTLLGTLPQTFGTLLTCFARALNGSGVPADLVAEGDLAKQKLLGARTAERTWDEAASMVDERTARTWSTSLMRDPLIRLGMRGAPEHIMVGLLEGRTDEFDPIGEALRRHAFQRVAVDFARRRSNVTCGRVGDRGILLVAGSLGGRSRARAALVDLATRASDLARRHGFRLRLGIAQSAAGQSLPARYRAALSAAERAFAQSASLYFAEERPDNQDSNIAQLRDQLGRSAEHDPKTLLPRFERYVDAVLVHSGYQFDVARAHLEAGLERMAAPLIASGHLDARSFAEIHSAVARAPGQGGAVAPLIVEFRHAVSLIERAIQNPTSARQDRSVQRALGFMRERFAEPLTLAQVSAVAGFAPDYFATLLKRREGLSFDLYLQRLRIEHSKRLLASTKHSVERVTRLSGFQSRTYFQQLFRERTGMTPGKYRREIGE